MTDRSAVPPVPPEPPALSARWNDTASVVAAGSLAFVVTSVVLLIARVAAGRDLDVWFATSVAGWGLGAIGYGIFHWQRAAARRGARGAQDGID